MRLLLLLILIALPLCGYSQIKDGPKPFNQEEKPSFFIDPLVFRGKDSTKARLDLYIQIQLGNLMFKRNLETEKFEASVEYNVIIKDSKEQIVVNATYPEKFIAGDVDLKTLASGTEFRVKQFYLPADIYKLEFIFRDKNNKQETTKELPLIVQDFNNKELTASSIMILTDYKEEEGKKKITPLISSNIGELRDLYVFYEIYNNSEISIPSTIVYKIIGDRDAVLKEGTFSYLLTPGTNQKIEKLSGFDYTTGTYNLVITSKGTDYTLTERTFDYKWDNIPMNIKDLDAAISQMIYIADPDQISYIKSATTNAEKERRFMKFWKDNDPNPNTVKNETMEEYYRRVRVATERYSQYVEGWRTDMGMVYIIYGDPSNIERHPFNSDSRPYEVWDYYDINKQFIFVDYTGFGDYRLVTPIWDKRFKVR